MRYIFAVIANRIGEIQADHDEMTAIDAFNEKIEAAGQRIMAVGVAAPDQAIVFDFRGNRESIVREPIVDGARKALLLREIAAREGISLEQVIAVGDGANDLPMLSIAGLGIAFRAKPLVKASAKHAISTLGLDGILYLLGISDRELAAS
jgi:phosphoserine phosphatase